MDDDLITPISDNEYVLKGCDVRRTPPPPAVAPKPSSTGDYLSRYDFFFCPCFVCDFNAEINGLFGKLRFSQTRRN
jgi:hypothetical protein